MRIPVHLKRKATAALKSPPGLAISRANKPRPVKVKGLQFNTDNPSITDRSRAAMIWGTYESAELRMIARFVDGQVAAVELGASVGITGGHLVSRLNSSGSYVGLEANEALLPTLVRNVTRHAKTRSVEVVHGALAYGPDPVYFRPGDSHVAGKLVEVGRLSDRALPKMTLGSLIAEHHVPDGYVLMADIEGAEMAMASEDTEALRRCGVAIIELHDGRSQLGNFSTEDVLARLLASGLKMLDRDGNVVALTPS